MAFTLLLFFNFYHKKIFKIKLSIVNINSFNVPFYTYVLYFLSQTPVRQARTNNYLYETKRHI